MKDELIESHNKLKKVRNRKGWNTGWILQNSLDYVVNTDRITLLFIIMDFIYPPGLDTNLPRNPFEIQNLVGG